MAVLAALSCLGFAPLVRISPAHPAHGAPFDPLTPVLTSSSITGRAHNLVMMGRAEKRMAKKRAAKGPQYQGGRPLKPSAKGDDRLPRKTVLTRLREAPVFGIRVLEGSDALRNEQGFLVQDGCDGLSTFYMNPREAEGAVASQGSGRGLRVTGLTLDAIFFDPSVQLKPDQSAMQAVGTIPSSRALTSPVTTPLYCIDGMQMTATESGVSSLPLFFSKDDLLQFAKPVYGSTEAANLVLVTSLDVVVQNMLQGPAGLLRNAKFFADAKALEWLEADKRQASTALFGTEGTLDSKREQGLFGGGLKMPWD